MQRGEEEADGFLCVAVGVWRRAIGFVSIDDVDLRIELTNERADGLAKDGP